MLLFSVTCLPTAILFADRHLPEVKTTAGVVRGRVVPAPQGSKVNEYLGVPFAQPPVGDLRYHDPVRLDKLPSGTSTNVAAYSSTFGASYWGKLTFIEAS